MNITMNRLFVIQAANAKAKVPQLNGIIEPPQHVKPTNDIVRLSVYRDNKLLLVLESHISLVRDVLRQRFDFRPVQIKLSPEHTFLYGGK